MRHSQGFWLYKQDEAQKERLARAMVRAVVALMTVVMEMDTSSGDGDGRRKW